jgi:hypothetical protein
MEIISSLSLGVEYPAGVPMGCVWQQLERHQTPLHGSAIATSNFTPVFCSWTAPPHKWCQDIFI